MRLTLYHVAAIGVPMLLIVPIGDGIYWLMNRYGRD
jgi:hypothetical protein